MTLTIPAILILISIKAGKLLLGMLAALFAFGAYVEFENSPEGTVTHKFLGAFIVFLFLASLFFYLV